MVFIFIFILILGEEAKEVVGADFPPGIDGQKFASLHPQYSHGEIPNEGGETAIFSIPSRCLRMELVFLSKLHSPQKSLSMCWMNCCRMKVSAQTRHHFRLQVWAACDQTGDQWVLAIAL